MKRSHTLLVVALSASVLAGCRDETASFMIDSKDKAVTLELNKEYPWSDWDLQMIVRNFPDCQRRHALKASGEAAPKVELYTPEPYVFILRQNKRWYVTDMKTCQFQAFKEPPPLPGALIGTFQEKDGAYKFVKNP